MFKAGDRVKYKNGETFSNGRLVNTVDKIVDGGQVWLLETKTWIGVESIEHESPTKSPVRTVTRREIVPGVYGKVRVNECGIGGGVESIEMKPTRSPEELRESAHILNQLAEALEDKP